MYGSGKPRAAHDGAIKAMLTFLAVIRAVEDFLHRIRELPLRVFEFLANQCPLFDVFLRLENGRF